MEPPGLYLSPYLIKRSVMSFLLRKTSLTFKGIRMYSLLNFFRLFCVIFSLVSVHADWTFPPIPITEGTGNAQAKVCCMSDGTALAFWLASGGVITTAFYNGTEWLDNGIIPGTLGVSDYQLCCNADGDIFVIWFRFDGFGHIEAGHFEGTTWQGTTTLMSADGISILFVTAPTICCDSSGNAMAAWTALDNFAQLTIYYSRFAFDGMSFVWSTAAQMPFTGVASTDPDLCCDSAGNVFLVFSENADQIFSAYFDANTLAWSLLDLASKTANAVTPSVCCNDDGNALAIWRNDLSNQLEASSFFNGTWSNLSPLSEGGISVVSFDLCCTSALNATVIWNTANIPDKFIQVSQFNAADLQPGLPPVTPLTLDSATHPDFFGTPQVCCTDSGTAVAIWLKATSGTFQTFATNYDAGMWSPLVPLTDQDLNIGDPFVCCRENGDAIAVWALFSGDNAGVDSAFFTALNLLPPASFAGCRFTNRFATQSAEFALLRWTTSPTEGVVSYRIFRNGVLIATVPATQLNFRDCLIPCGSITYTITSINEGGDESSAAVITI